jgi:large subunit ribosomal protein L6
MSRVGKKPLAIPAGVTVTVADGEVKVKGPKGELKQALHPDVTVTVDGSEIKVTVKDPELKLDNSLWGLFRRLVENMIIGVTVGYVKKLEMNGVGYKASVAGKVLTLDVGFSHDIKFPIPDGIAASVEKNVITIAGIDKQLVGETAAQIRAFRKPEPFLGKGIKYSDEVIIRKAGKTAKSGS